MDKLRQLVSLNIFSFLGYANPIIVMWAFMLPSIGDRVISSIILLLFIIVFPILALLVSIILLLIIPIEYYIKSRKPVNKTLNKAPYFFIIGIILNILCLSGLLIFIILFFHH